MIPKECKRLAEVDFPIARVSSSSLLENARRTVHPKGLHLWWARRPLASCRAVLLSLFLPDPIDQRCPENLLQIMREIFLTVPGRPVRWDTSSKTREGLRKIALQFIADFSHPDNACRSRYIDCARNLVAKLNDGEPPLVYDSFAGGGSIPLEALRLGCDVIGSDLNPLACLILRSELELIPQNGDELVHEFEQAGKIIGERFRSVAANYFSQELSGAPIAYLWARHAVCESPTCGVIFPLVSEFWLCKKAGHETAFRMCRPNEGPNLVPQVFNPISDSEVPRGTVINGRGCCPICGVVLENDRLRSQLAQNNGGIEQAKLLVIVTQDPITGRKHYRNANPDDVRIAKQVIPVLEEILERSGYQSFSPIPNEPIPRTELRRISAPLYGCTTWQDLFLYRQRLSLYLLLHEIRKYAEEADKEDLLPLFALAFGKILRHWNSNAKWHTKSENVAGAFGRQAIPMAYFFPEQFPLATSGAGSWNNAIESVALAARAVVGLGNRGLSLRADACDIPLPSDSVSVWFTDPPYYDAVAYAHLADFFYVWISRLLSKDPLFKEPLIDKTQECVVDRPHSQSPSQKKADWFETKMGEAMVEARRLLAEDGVASVVFAHKTTEGWEAIIGAMLNAGWVITASWPISTERGARLNARDNASLATSVHLICRPRPEDATVGDWGEVLNELPIRVGDWMERLQKEHIRGADLVFACIGPALEIFSRYSKVETAEGTEITLAQYLEKVWEVVGRFALEQILGTTEAQAKNGMAGALEEDARLTALFLWTLQSTNGDNGNNHINDDVDDDNNDDEEAPIKAKIKGFSLIFDVVRRFAQPLGIHLPEWEGRIIETKKGVVRLFAISERAEQLFGREGTQVAADRIEHSPLDKVQMTLFPELEEERMVRVRGRRRSDAKQGTLIVNDEALNARREATTLGACRRIPLEPQVCFTVE